MAATKKPETTTIYSMLSNDEVYPVYKTPGKGVQAANVIEEAVIIKGGANVRDPLTMRDRDWVETEVTEAQLEILKANDSFMRVVGRGFITIGEEPKLLQADASAQLTEKQVKEKAPAAEVKAGKVS